MVGDRAKEKRARRWWFLGMGLSILGGALVGLVGLVVSLRVGPIEFTVRDVYCRLTSYRAGSTGILTLDRIPGGLSFRAPPVEQPPEIQRWTFIRVGDTVLVVETWWRRPGYVHES
jgi:hypothetical protein